MPTRSQDALGARASRGSGAERETGADHDDAQSEVEPVVRAVERDEVGLAALVDHEAVEPQHQINGTAYDEVGDRTPGCACQGQSDRAEEEMHDVVQDRDLED